MSVAYDEQIKARSGISPESMGTVHSAFPFAYMVCMTPGGVLRSQPIVIGASEVTMALDDIVFGHSLFLGAYPFHTHSMA